MPPKGNKKAVAAPIFQACEDGSVGAVAEILAGSAAALEMRNADGWTPLICASFNGELEVVDLLLSKGADPTAVCKDGDTALHYASAQGHPDVIKRLGQCATVKLDCTDNDGETPEDVAQSAKIKRLIQQLAAAREAADDGKAGGADGGEEEEEDEGEEA